MESVRIPLTQGQFALVDAADAALVSGRKWRATRGRLDTFYARTGPPSAQIWMHRLILGLPPGKVPEVDHINNDGLDNRRGNLRTASQSENLANTRRSINNRSGFKGVISQEGYWIATAAGEYLGMFDSAKEAARAYDTAARQRWGEFARLNFPDETSEIPSRVWALKRSSKSGYRGVSYRKPNRGRAGGWVARFAHKGARLHLGLFPTKEAAARAWDAKATELLGPSARLNFPIE